MTHTVYAKGSYSIGGHFTLNQSLHLNVFIFQRSHDKFVSGKISSMAVVFLCFFSAKLKGRRRPETRMNYLPWQHVNHIQDRAWANKYSVHPHWSPLHVLARCLPNHGDTRLALTEVLTD